ncbi:MAG TPA: Ku protein [Verrucomicrobiales bacterium]|nr:Ku protein [Verrucomicrobiales bacterium]
MRPIWKGSINFGLVNIPITLYTAVQKEELSFKLLRASDLSPINYKRVAAADGKEVPWDKIVKGYEYEKGKFVVLKDEDFRRVDIEATQSVTIESFVDVSEVNPLHFYKPYYMEPQKGADHAYVLLRDALNAAKKIGISRVVIKTRQHLAAVKPQEGGLMLELMHFAEDLVDVGEFRAPKAIHPGKKELDMAGTLIKSMSEKWKPEAFKDEYTGQLEKVIEEKVKAGGKPLPKAKGAAKPSNVIDLMDALKQSLAGGSSTKSKKPSASKSKPAPHAKSKSRPRKKAS